MTNTDDFVQCTTDTQQLPYKEFAGTMEQSPNDHRQHKLIRLSNNLQVLCTHDPHTSMAAASMTVNVGTFIDPPELPGLAHLLEHMLLMGSEKYPNEDDYNMFVSNNGGNQNASTYDSITTYHFHTAHHAMEGALDRLAAAFINPRFAPECIDREVNAVDSEYKGLQQDDEMYLQQLKKSLETTRWTS
ncbi:metalloprotease [Coemansia sp. RSA 720]|nr:metalloprotease [Coemansia sp. RSA 720]